MAGTKRVTTLELNLTSRTAKGFLADLAREADNTRNKIAQMTADLANAKKLGSKRLEADTDASYAERLEKITNLPKEIKKAQDQLNVFNTILQGNVKNINALAEAIDTKANMSLKRMQQAMKEYQQKMQGMGKVEDTDKFLAYAAKLNGTMRLLQGHVAEVKRGFQDVAKEARAGLDNVGKSLNQIPNLLNVMRQQLDAMPQALGSMKGISGAVTALFGDKSTVVGGVKAMKRNIMEALKFTPSETAEWNILKGFEEELNKQQDKMKGLSREISTWIATATEQDKARIKQVQKAMDEIAKGNDVQQNKNSIFQLTQQMGEGGRIIVQKMRDLRAEIDRLSTIQSLGISKEQQMAIRDVLAGVTKDMKDFADIYAKVMSGQLTGKDAPVALQAIVSQVQVLRKNVGETQEAFDARMKTFRSQVADVVQQLRLVGMTTDQAREAVAALQEKRIHLVDEKERTIADQLINDLNQFIKQNEGRAQDNVARNIISRVFGTEEQMQRTKQAAEALGKAEADAAIKTTQAERELLDLEAKRNAEKEKLKTYNQQLGTATGNLTTAQKENEEAQRQLELLKQQKAEHEALEQKRHKLYSSHTQAENKQNDFARQATELNQKIIAQKAKIAELEGKIAAEEQKAAQSTEAYQEALARQKQGLDELIIQQSKLEALKTGSAIIVNDNGPWQKISDFRYQAEEVMKIFQRMSYDVGNGNKGIEMNQLDQAIDKVGKKLGYTREEVIGLLRALTVTSHEAKSLFSTFSFEERGGLWQVFWQKNAQNVKAYHTEIKAAEEELKRLETENEKNVQALNQFREGTHGTTADTSALTAELQSEQKTLEQLNKQHVEAITKAATWGATAKALKAAFKEATDAMQQETVSTEKLKEAQTNATAAADKLRKAERELNTLKAGKPEAMTDAEYQRQLTAAQNLKKEAEQSVNLARQKVEQEEKALAATEAARKASIAKNGIDQASLRRFNDDDLALIRQRTAEQLKQATLQKTVLEMTTEERAQYDFLRQSYVSLTAEELRRKKGLEEEDKLVAQQMQRMEMLARLQAAYVEGVGLIPPHFKLANEALKEQITFWEKDAAAIRMVEGESENYNQSIMRANALKMQLRSQQIAEADSLMSGDISKKSEESIQRAITLYKEVQHSAELDYETRKRITEQIAKGNAELERSKQLQTAADAYARRTSVSNFTTNDLDLLKQTEQSWDKIVQQERLAGKEVSEHANYLDSLREKNMELSEEWRKMVMDNPFSYSTQQVQQAIVMTEQLIRTKKAQNQTYDDEMNAITRVRQQQEALTNQQKSNDAITKMSADYKILADAVAQRIAAEERLRGAVAQLTQAENELRAVESGAHAAEMRETQEEIAALERKKAEADRYYELIDKMLQYEQNSNLGALIAAREATTTNKDWEKANKAVNKEAEKHPEYMAMQRELWEYEDGKRSSTYGPNDMNRYDELQQKLQQLSTSEDELRGKVEAARTAVDNERGALEKLPPVSRKNLEAQEKFWQSEIDKAQAAGQSTDTFRAKLAEVQQLQKTNAMSNLGLTANGTSFDVGTTGMLAQLNDQSFPKTIEWLNKLKQEVEAFKTKFVTTPEGAQMLNQQLEIANTQLQALGATAASTGQQNLFTLDETRQKMGEILANMAARKSPFDGTTAEIEKMNASLKKHRDNLAKYGKDVTNFDRAIRGMKGALDTTKVSLTDFDRILKRPKGETDYEKVAYVLSVIRERARAAGKVTTEMAAQMRMLDKQAKELNKTFGYHASTLEQAASRLKSYVMIYMGFNALMMKARQMVSANLELADSISNVQKVSGLAHKDVEKLSNALQNMQTRTAQNELMQIAYQGSKMGVAMEGGRGALEQFVVSANKLNSALGEDFGGAEAIGKLTKLAQVMHITGAYNKDLNEALEKTGSAILTLGNNSTASYTYIQQFASRLGGIANLAHIAMPDLLAIGSTLDTVEMPAEMAATAMTKFIATLSKKPEQIEKAIGLGPDTLKNLVDAQDTMGALTLVFQTLYEKRADLSDIANILKDLVGGGNNTRALQVLSSMAAAYKTLVQHVDMSNDAFEEGTAIQKEYEIMNENAAASAKRMGNAIRNMFVNASGSSGFGMFMKKMADFFEFFQQNGKTLLAFIITLASHFGLIGKVWDDLKIRWATFNSDLLADFDVLKKYYELQIKHGIFADGDIQLSLMGKKVTLFTGETAVKMRMMGERCKLVFREMGLAIQKVGTVMKSLAKSFMLFAAMDLMMAWIDGLNKVNKLTQAIDEAEADVGKTLLGLKQKWHAIFEEFGKAEKGKENYLKLERSIVSELEKHISREELVNQGILDEQGNIIDLAKAYDILTQAIIKSERAKVGEGLVAEVEGERVKRQTGERRKLREGFDQMIDALPEGEKEKYSPRIMDEFIEAANAAAQLNLKRDKINQKTNEQLLQEIIYRTDVGQKVQQLYESTSESLQGQPLGLMNGISMKYQQVKAWLNDSKEAGQQVYTNAVLEKNPAYYLPGMLQMIVNATAGDEEDIKYIQDVFGVRDLNIDELIGEFEHGDFGDNNGNGNGNNLTDISQKVIAKIKDAIKDSQEQTGRMFDDVIAVLNEQAKNGSLDADHLETQVKDYTQQRELALEAVNRFVHREDGAINPIMDIFTEEQLAAWEQEATETKNETMRRAVAQLRQNRMLANQNANLAFMGMTGANAMGVVPRTKYNKNGDVSSQEYIDWENVRKAVVEMGEELDLKIAESLRKQAAVDGDRAKKIRAAILEGAPLAKVSNEFYKMLADMDIFFDEAKDRSEEAVANRLSELNAFASRITTMTYEEFQEQLAVSRYYRDLDAAEQKVLYDKLLKYRDDYDEAARKQAKQSLKLLINRVESGEYYAQQLASLRKYQEELVKAGKTGTEAYLSVARAIEVVGKKQNMLVDGKQTTYQQRMKQMLESANRRVKMEEGVKNSGVNNGVQLGQAKLRAATTDFAMAMEEYQIRREEANRIILDVLKQIEDAKAAMDALEEGTEEHEKARIQFEALGLKLKEAKIKEAEYMADTYDKMLEKQRAVAEQEAEIQAERINNVQEFAESFRDVIERVSMADITARDAKAFELSKLRYEKELGLVQDFTRQRYLIIRKDGDNYEKWMTQEEAILFQQQIDAQNQRREALAEGLKNFGEKIGKQLRDAMNRQMELREEERKERDRQKVIQNVQAEALAFQRNAEHNQTLFLKSELDSRLEYWEEYFRGINRMQEALSPSLSPKGEGAAKQNGATTNRTNQTNAAAKGGTTTTNNANRGTTVRSKVGDLTLTEEQLKRMVEIANGSVESVIAAKQQFAKELGMAVDDFYDLFDDFTAQFADMLDNTITKQELVVTASAKPKNVATPQSEAVAMVDEKSWGKLLQHAFANVNIDSVIFDAISSSTKKGAFGPLTDKEAWKSIGISLGMNMATAASGVLTEKLGEWLNKKVIPNWGEHALGSERKATGKVMDEQLKLKANEATVARKRTEKEFGEGSDEAKQAELAEAYAETYRELHRKAMDKLIKEANDAQDAMKKAVGTDEYSARRTEYMQKANAQVDEQEVMQQTLSVLNDKYGDRSGYSNYLALSNAQNAAQQMVADQGWKAMLGENGDGSLVGTTMGDVLTGQAEYDKIAAYVAAWAAAYDEIGAKADETMNKALANDKTLSDDAKAQVTQQTKDAKVAFDKQQKAGEAKEKGLQAASMATAAVSSGVQDMITQASGNAMLGQMSGTLAQVGGNVIAGIASGSAKTMGEMGWWGAVYIPLIQSALMALLGLATSKMKKAQAEVSQATGASSGKLTTGMLTYSTGRYLDDEELKNGRITAGMMTMSDGYQPGQSYSVDGADGNSYSAKYEGAISKTGIRKGTHFGIFSEVKPEMVIDGDTTALMHNKYPMLENAILQLHRTGTLNMGEMLGLNYAGISKTIDTLYGSGRLSFPGMRMPTFAAGRYPGGSLDGLDSLGGLESLGNLEPTAAQQADIESRNRLAAAIEAMVQNGVSATIESKSIAKRARFEKRNGIKNGVYGMPR